MTTHRAVCPCGWSRAYPAAWQALREAAQHEQRCSGPVRVEELRRGSGW